MLRNQLWRSSFELLLGRLSIQVFPAPFLFLPTGAKSLKKAADASRQTRGATYPPTIKGKCLYLQPKLMLCYLGILLLLPRIMNDPIPSSPPPVLNPATNSFPPEKKGVERKRKYIQEGKEFRRFHVTSLDLLYTYTGVNVMYSRVSLSLPRRAAKAREDRGRGIFQISARFIAVLFPFPLRGKVCL